jgi:hypothetical protein
MTTTDTEKIRKTDMTADKKGYDIKVYQAMTNE